MHPFLQLILILYPPSVFTLSLSRSFRVSLYFPLLNWQVSIRKNPLLTDHFQSKRKVFDLIPLRKLFPYISFIMIVWRLYDGYKEILKIQKFRRIVSYTVFFCFSAGISYAYNSNTTRAGYSRADQFYASYPAGTELLTDQAKLYKAALGNVFEEEDWGPVEYMIMAKHFERQGKSPYAYHAQYMAHLLSLGQLDRSG